MSPGTPAGTHPDRGRYRQLTLGAVPAVATPPVGAAALVEPIRIEGFDPAPLRLAAILVTPVRVPPVALAPIPLLSRVRPRPLAGAFATGNSRAACWGV
jgi:hypothetical protein